jgi:hypothetical protein
MYYCFIVLMYYRHTFKNTIVITVCETHMFYMSCNNNVIYPIRMHRISNVKIVNAQLSSEI